MGFTNPYPASRLTVDSTNSLVTGMQAFFPLTEGSGSVVDCILHPSHTGTVTNGTWQTGDGGTELFLSGSGSFVTIGDLNLNSANGLTVTAWIDGGSYGGNDQIVTRDNSGGSRHWQFRTGTSGSLNLIRFNSGNSLVANFSGSTSLTNGVRYFVAFTFDSSSGSVLYVNGEVDGTDSNTTANNSGTGTDILIGARRSSGVISDSLPAAFQNVRVYERALSASEIATLYHRPWEGTNYGDIWPYSPPASASMTLSTDTAATSLNSGCVHWWPLTGDATDVTTTADNLTATGTPTWVNGELGTGVELVSNTTYLTSSVYGNTYQVNTPITISAWVKFMISTSDNGMLSYADTHTNGTPLYTLQSSGAYLRWYAKGAYSSGMSAAVGEWHHVALTNNGTSIDCYLNGAYETTLSGLITTAGEDANNKFWIGAGYRYNNTNQFQNVRIWDRALSAAEISILHERPWEGIEYGDTFHYDPPAPASMLPLTSDAINTDQIGWWPLTETNDYASGAADISGNAYDGTKNGTITSESAALGTVANFDGSTGYFQHSNTLAQSFTNSFSVSFWARPESSASDQRAVTNWVTPGNTGAQWNVWLDVVTGGIRWAAAIYDQSGTYQIAGTTVASATLNEWQHVCATWSSSSTDLLVYVDGVEMASITASNMFASTASTSFQIGNSATESKYFDGDIANVRVWTRELTSTEVWSIYANPWLGSNYKLASGSGSTPLYNYIFRTERFRRLG